MRAAKLIMSLVLLVSMPMMAGKKENKEFLDKVIQEFREECKGKKSMEYLNC